MSSFDEPSGRQATTVGSYAPNHFLIKLGASAPFLSVDDSGAVAVDPHYMSIFWHEYIHFWHNISTVSGFLALAHSHHILAAVSNGVAAAGGISAGHAELAKQDKLHLQGLTKWYSALEGDVRPRGVDPSASLVRVKAARTAVDTVQLANGPTKIERLVLKVDVKTQNQPSSHEVVLGSLMLEEAAALSAQGVVDAQERTTWSWHTRDFPYHVSNRLFESVVGVEPTPSQSFMCATTALMDRFPGPAFLRLLKAIRQRTDDGKSVNDAVQHAVQTFADDQSVKAAVDLILNQDLPDLVRLHKGRGYLENAIEEYDSLFRKAITARSRHIAFDTKLFFSDDIAAVITNHLREYPNCNILQQRGAVSNLPRDLMTGMGDRDATPLRVLQAVQHLAAYFARQVTGEPRASRCPFFHCCGLAFRQRAPSRCQKSPWEWAQENPTCWYGSATLGLTGTLVPTKLSGSASS